MEAARARVDAGAQSIQGRVLWWWAATVISFPIAGVLARVIVGPISAVWTAILAGAIAGVVIGSAQWVALRVIGVSPLWIAATAVGFAVGLGLAVGMFGYGTSVGDLAILGALSGLGIGTAQWLLLRGVTEVSTAWIPGTALFWALGWIVTTSIGVDAEAHWAVFGLSGAAAAVLLSGALLWLLRRPEPHARASG